MLKCEEPQTLLMQAYAAPAGGKPNKGHSETQELSNCTYCLPLKTNREYAGGMKGLKFTCWAEVLVVHATVCQEVVLRCYGKSAHVECWPGTLLAREAGLSCIHMALLPDDQPSSSRAGKLISRVSASLPQTRWVQSLSVTLQRQHNGLLRRLTYTIIVHGTHRAVTLPASASATACMMGTSTPWRVANRTAAGAVAIPSATYDVRCVSDSVETVWMAGEGEIPQEQDDVHIPRRRSPISPAMFPRDQGAVPRYDSATEIRNKSALSHQFPRAHCSQGVDTQ